MPSSIFGNLRDNMAENTFGTFFRITTFGESHGAAIGGVIDGCPAGLKIDLKLDRKSTRLNSSHSS